MTPLGHASVSYIVGKKIATFSLAGCLIGGALPDIDFVFLFFPFFNTIHRVVTHNLAFVIVTSILIGLFFKQNRAQVIYSLMIGGVIHLFIDSILDQNPTNGIGVAIFYPFSEWMFSPFNLLEVRNDGAGWSDIAGSLKSLGVPLLYEVPFYMLALYFLYRSKWRNADG